MQSNPRPAFAKLDLVKAGAIALAERTDHAIAPLETFQCTQKKIVLFTHFLNIVITFLTFHSRLLPPLPMWSAWSVGLFLLGCLFLLLILYLRGAFHHKVQYRMKDIPTLDDPHFPIAMKGVSASSITYGNITGSWYSIDEIYQERNAAIRRAKRTIHFETFFMTPGQRADEFSAALMERSQAGVEVQLLIDSFGSHTITASYWKELKKAGIQLHFFHEFNWRSPLAYNIRTHRKLLIIDGEVAYIGGMGVSDHWDGMQEIGDTAPWLDFEVRFAGPIVATLEGIFMQHWLYVGGLVSLGSDIFNPTLSGGKPMIVTPSNSPSGSSSVCALFYTNVLAAKKRIWIASPYFLPDSNSLNALLKAKRNGVDVRVLTVGPHNDKKMIYYAVRERYRVLLAAGIEIYEYQPSMMHAKVWLIDEGFVSTGSANFDPRSLFHNDELSVSFAEANFAKFVERFFLEGFAKSRLIEMKHWKRRPLWQRCLGAIALFFRWQL